MFRYTGHKTQDMSIECAIIASDSHILCGSVTGDLFCWDMVSAEVVRKMIHTPGRVLNSLSVHPTKDIILTASGPNVKVWCRPEDFPESKSELMED